MRDVVLWIVYGYAIVAAVFVALFLFANGRRRLWWCLTQGLLWPTTFWLMYTDFISSRRRRGQYRKLEEADAYARMLDVEGNVVRGHEDHSKNGALGAALAEGYKTTIQRMCNAGDKSVREFVERHLASSSVVNAVSQAGLQKMGLTATDGKEHSVAWTLADSVMIGVQTIPASRDEAANWYSAEFSGYSGYVNSVVAPILQSTKKDVMVHVIFGQDEVSGGWQPWTSIAILPIRNPQLVGTLLPRTCCNARERDRYGL